MRACVSFLGFAGVGSAMAVFAGFTYPLDFLLHLDAYRTHLSAIDIVRLYGWGFAVEAVIVACCVALVVATGAAIGGRRRAHVTRWLVAALVLAGLGATLANGGFAWLRTQSWWTTLNPSAGLKLALVVGATALVAVAAAFEGPRRRFRDVAQSLALLSIAAALVGLMLIGFVGKEPPIVRADAPAQGPSVILISIDALSAKHLSSYGYGRPTSPEIDRFAAGATLFAHFYSVSNWTSPGTNALINGVRPWDSELLTHHARAPRSVSEHGLAADLRRAGYANYMVVTNNYASPFVHHTETDWDAIAYDELWNWGPHCYWDTFEENFLLLKMLRQAGGRLAVAVGLRGPADQFVPERAFALARTLVERRDPARPFFLWVHLLPPHDPYAAPAPHAGMFNPSPDARTMLDSLATYHSVPPSQQARQALLRDRYDEAVHYSDANVGAFIAWLDAQRLADNAVIAVTSDHGESFSHDYGGHGGPGLHDELIHVPLIVKMPGQTAPQVVQDVMDQSAFADVVRRTVGLPAAAAASGSGAPWPVQAWSMNFERSASSQRRFNDGAIAAISWPWKYVEERGDPEPGQPSRPAQLFNLHDDPAEANDRLRDAPDVAASLRGAVRAQIEARQPRPR